MTLLNLAKPWTRQPQGGLVEINSSHRLSNGLITYGTVIQGVPWDAKNRRFLTPAGTTGRRLTSRGFAATTGTGSGDLWTAPCAFPMAGKTAGSIFIIAYSAASSITKKRAIRLQGVAGGVLAVDFGDGVTNRIVGTAQVVGATFPRSGSVTTPTANTLYSVLWCRSGYTQDLYVNGVENTSTEDASSSNALVGDITDLVIGNSASDLPLNGGVVYWGAWDRRLSAAEAAELHRAPWQLFAPRRLLVPVANTLTYSIPRSLRLNQAVNRASTY